MFHDLRKKHKSIEFTIKDMDLSIVNAVRRIILSEVPTVAIPFDVYANENIVVNKNTGALNNEFLLHRISLLPLCFTGSEIDTFESDKFVFKLQANKPGFVTSKDIKIHDADDEQYSKEFHTQIFPMDSLSKDHILITKLKQGEEIDIEFRASVGIGADHVRWCPVSQCAYSFKEQNSHELTFKLSSECGMTPMEIFEKGLNILIGKMANLLSLIEKGEITARHIENNMYEVVLNGEDHTLANVIQSCLYNQRDPKLLFIGYYKPHPLVKTVVFKMRLDGEKDVLKYLLDHCRIVHSDLIDIGGAWKLFST